ncbi:MAG TPA: hypothetical protein VEK08_01995, partial [Planctomycetota bacterium]|nr:hypothetical protein [Planctomycetota bacterium]
LGLGNAGDPVTFHAVHLLEISARGRPIRAAAPKEPRRVNLLPLINPVRDAVVGTWTMREGSLVSDSTGEFPPQGRGGARLQIPYKPPEEYDLRVSFTRLSGLHCVAVLFPMNGETLTFIAGGYDNRLAGFEMVNGHGSRVGQNPTTVHRNGWLTNQRQELVLQVRKRQARVLLDGSEIMRSPDNYAGMSTAVWYRLNDGALPGIGSWASPMAFHVIELTEISGTGSPVR